MKAFVNNPDTSDFQEVSVCFEVGMTRNVLLSNAGRRRQILLRTHSETGAIHPSREGADEA